MLPFESSHFETLQEFGCFNYHIQKPWSCGEYSELVTAKFLGIIGQGPSDSKSNQFNVDIFQFCFHSFEVYSTDSSKMVGDSLEVSNFNQLFLRSRSHQTFHLVLAVKLLGIMLKNRCCSTTFHTITTGNVDG